MSLHTIAKQMAAHGRGPDTELVHMTKGEVAGLQKLALAHGGSLTINPHTGLVEAGWLSKLLPTIAGAALAATGVGAPMAALMIGGGSALATGDLKQGLMAGLGAYGGAGLMGGAATMGAEEVATQAGQQAGEKAGAEALNTTAEKMATEEGSKAALQTSYPDVSGNITPETTYVDPTKAQQYGQAYGEAYKPAYDTANVKNFANTGEGLKAAAQNPSAYLDKIGGGAGAARYGLAAIGPSLVPDLKQSTMPAQEPYSGPLSKYKFDPSKYTPYEPDMPNPYYRAHYDQYAGYSSGGGVVEQMSNANSVGQNTGYPQAAVNQGAYATPWQTPISRNVVADASDTGVDSFTGEPRGMAGGGIVDPQTAARITQLQQSGQFAAGGGVAALGGYSDGGQMLKGPGDGMSDSIPAQIGSKQPARLADGEFVVPADVVSHLGNGSSDAGAKQLYAMMDRIRKARTGKKKQAPEVNPSKAMPV